MQKNINIVDYKHDNLEIRGLNSTQCWDYENAFYWFSHPTRIAKILAHLDLYKKIIDLPGEIIECGMYKGVSSIRFATFRNLLENDYSRKIIGFDTFGDFPSDNLTLETDINTAKSFTSETGLSLTKDELYQIYSRKGFRNVYLREGNVFETIPELLRENPAIRIALLHLDMDVMEPTVFALEQLYERVVPNGLIVFDDYNVHAGETIAVDHFIQEKNLKLQKTPYYELPSFTVKPGTG